MASVIGLVVHTRRHRTHAAAVANFSSSLVASDLLRKNEMVEFLDEVVIPQERKCGRIDPGGVDSQGWTVIASGTPHVFELGAFQTPVDQDSDIGNVGCTVDIFIVSVD